MRWNNWKDNPPKKNTYIYYKKNNENIGLGEVLEKNSGIKVVFDPADANDRGVIPQEWLPIPAPSNTWKRTPPPPTEIYIWSKEEDNIDLGWTIEGEDGVEVVMAPFVLLNRSNLCQWQRVKELN